MITYEYPFNERIRALLRLEDLFEKATYFIERQGPREHHVGLLALFEILEVASRADLKMDLIQELERQRQSLLAFRNNPEISEEVLSGVLSEIEQSSMALRAMTGKIGQYLRENEWLMAIKSRAVIPGGVCEFDLPSYHYWQHQEVDARQQALREWLQPLLPLRDGLVIVLRLLRASGASERQLACGGSFHLMLSGSTSQMICVSLAKQLPFIPEISANRYALNIRFIRQDIESRHRQTDSAVDVPFDITFCNL
ncbi:MAG: cell division protein ZapD [Candidatus Accumulibacter sp.]|nr:cell division protein ZapD [Accumulibacter sp.]